MAKLLSTKDPVPVTIETAEGERIYYVIPPSLYSKAQIGRAIRMQGAVETTLADVLVALEDGIKAILPKDADKDLRDAQLAIVEDFRARLSSDDSEERAKAFLDISHPIHDLIRTVRPHFPALARVEADSDFYWATHHIESCRMLLYSVQQPGEGGGITLFERGPTGLTDDALLAVPEADRALLGLKIRSFFAPSEAEAKNSDSPSPGPCSPESSTSAVTASKPPRKTRSKATPGSSKKSASAS